MSDLNNLIATLQQHRPRIGFKTKRLRNVDAVLVDYLNAIKNDPEAFDKFWATSFEEVNNKKFAAEIRKVRDEIFQRYIDFLQQFAEEQNFFAFNERLRQISVIIENASPEVQSKLVSNIRANFSRLVNFDIERANGVYFAVQTFFTPDAKEAFKQEIVEHIKSNLTQFVKRDLQSALVFDKEVNYAVFSQELAQDATEEAKKAIHAIHHHDPIRIRYFLRKLSEKPNKNSEKIAAMFTYIKSNVSAIIIKNPREILDLIRLLVSLNTLEACSTAYALYSAYQSQLDGTDLTRLQGRIEAEGIITLEALAIKIDQLTAKPVPSEAVSHEVGDANRLEGEQVCSLPSDDFFRQPSESLMPSNISQNDRDDTADTNAEEQPVFELSPLPDSREPADIVADYSAEKKRCKDAVGEENLGDFADQFFSSRRLGFEDFQQLISYGIQTAHVELLKDALMSFFERYNVQIRALQSASQVAQLNENQKKFLDNQQIMPLISAFSQQMSGILRVFFDDPRDVLVTENENDPVSMPLFDLAFLTYVGLFDADYQLEVIEQLIVDVQQQGHDSFSPMLQNLLSYFVRWGGDLTQEVSPQGVSTGDDSATDTVDVSTASGTPTLSSMLVHNGVAVSWETASEFGTDDDPEDLNFDDDPENNSQAPPRPPCVSSLSLGGINNTPKSAPGSARPTSSRIELPALLSGRKPKNDEPLLQFVSPRRQVQTPRASSATNRAAQSIFASMMQVTQRPMGQEVTSIDTQRKEAGQGEGQEGRSLQNLQTLEL